MKNFYKDFGDATLEASFGNTQQGVNEMCNLVDELRNTLCATCRCLSSFSERYCMDCYYRKENQKNG